MRLDYFVKRSSILVFISCTYISPDYHQNNINMYLKRNNSFKKQISLIKVGYNLYYSILMNVT